MGCYHPYALPSAHAASSSARNLASSARSQLEKVVTLTSALAAAAFRVMAPLR